jgi:hypothetical protein
LVSAKRHARSSAEHNSDKHRGLSQRANCTDRAKLVLTFEDRAYRVDSTTDPYGRILGFLDLICTHEAEWTPFLTH